MDGSERRMRRFEKVIIWGIGFVILILLLRFPVDKQVGGWDNSVSPVAGKVIVLDPGHGGADGGAKSGTGVDEKDIVLEISKMMRELLESAGAIVYLTRESDVDLAGDIRGLSKRKSADIRNRLAFIEEKEADIFISVHLNALHSSRWRGAQTFYDVGKPENKHLATMIQDEIIRNLENTDRVPLAIKGIYLLKHAEVPGALVELGFLSNDAEANLLQQEAYQKQLAASVYQGVLQYFTIDMPEE